MKLYFYSGKSSAFVKARWIKTKSAFVGVIIGAGMYIGVVALNRSNGNTLGIHAENIMTENNILRQHVLVTAPRLHNLEQQVLQLYERDYILHQILDRRQVVEDSVHHATDKTKSTKIVYLIPAVEKFHR
jgi:hypothetical protein